jgi:hypothetical protein
MHIKSGSKSWTQQKRPTAAPACHNQKGGMSEDDGVCGEIWRTQSPFLGMDFGPPALPR